MSDVQMLNMLLPMASAAITSNGNNGMAPLETDQTASNGISADEIALYDRQIRLWGMAAQERIRSANVLVITMRALGNEIAKNLVLAGIGSLTIVDDALVTPTDLGAQFSLTQDSLGTPRAEAAASFLRRLNPRVAVRADASDIRTKSPDFFSPFAVVVATDLDPSTLGVVNTAARVHGRAFYAAGAHGVFGFVFADLIEHDFVISRARPNVPTKPGRETRTRAVLAVSPKPGSPDVELVTKRELYSTWLMSSDGSRLPAEIAASPRRRRAVTPALSCLRGLWAFMQDVRFGGRAPDPTSREELAAFTTLVSDRHRALGLPGETLRSEFLRRFMQNIGAEIAPVAAVLGGQLAQDVINVLGGEQQPVQNTVIFDGDTMEASVYALHPEGEELGRGLLASSDAALAAVSEMELLAAGGIMTQPIVGSDGQLIAVPLPDYTLGGNMDGPAL